jgi:hypothetical protein
VGVRTCEVATALDPADKRDPGEIRYDWSRIEHEAAAYAIVTGATEFNRAMKANHWREDVKRWVRGERPPWTRSARETDLPRRPSPRSPA